VKDVLSLVAWIAATTIIAWLIVNWFIL